MIILIFAAAAMTTELPDFPTLVVRVVVTGIILVLYVYDLVKTFNHWRDGDRRYSGSFRGLIKSVNLTVGLMIIFIGAVTAAFFSNDPFIRDLLRFLGYVLLGTLLVGGIALTYSWWSDRRHSATLEVEMRGS